MNFRTAILSIVTFCAAVSSAAQNFNVSSSLQSHVEYLCSDSVPGRKAGTEGERMASDYVYDRLKEAGVVMLTGKEGQDFTIEAPDGDIKSRNIVGVVQGYDTLLRNEYILVGAHVDNLGLLETTVDGRKVVKKYPGADDNASGVAALIELARLVAANDFHFRRSILFVAFGASERGLAGSWYFANRAFGDIGSVKAAVNLDMLGRGQKEYPFRVFSSLEKQQLTRLLDKVLDEPVATPPALFEGTLQTSDHLPFYEKKIPVFVFTTGMTHEYRTVDDVPSLIQYRNLERSCNYIFYFLKTLASEGRLVQNEVPTAKASRRSEGDPVYSPADCDKRAQFFHSDEVHFLSSWVYKYLKYPEDAVQEGVQGKVYVTFIVEKNGKISNVELERGVDERLDAEALRVVAASPDWIPAKIDGKAVRSRITIPVEFRLAKKFSISFKNGIKKKRK